MTEQIGPQEEQVEETVATRPIANAEPVRIEHFRAKAAGFWIRFWAYTIDLLVVSALSGILVKPIFRAADIEITNPSFLLFSPYKVTALLLFLVYFILMTKYLQQTVGKMIMGIKVMPKEGEKLTWSTVIFREGFGRFISKMLLIPYLLVLFMPRKEALHDLFADTIVIHENAYEKELRINDRSISGSQQLPEGTVI
ncbi:RDD family protein [Sporosarcina sp. ACRSM]|uniref:RDD family protein n=1 Tax=Sporosarcina sp. ACRSM TaxID=2918216 RepID=UPI001EF6EEB9|nr:RDD family protein [Sporosarcina sp. ACRSM]MCG7335522.1 RDD family protein [Sporosarcina sp. ACRSM]